MPQEPGGRGRSPCCRYRRSYATTPTDATTTARPVHRGHVSSSSLSDSPKIAKVDAHRRVRFLRPVRDTLARNQSTGAASLSSVRFAVVDAARVLRRRLHRHLLLPRPSTGSAEERGRGSEITQLSRVVSDRHLDRFRPFGSSGTEGAASGRPRGTPTLRWLVCRRHWSTPLRRQEEINIRSSHRTTPPREGTCHADHP